MTVVETRARVSLVVPTRNEAENIRPLVARVTDALGDLEVPWEVVFVDDSDDATPTIVRDEYADSPVRLLHREPDERADGLSGAVLHGIAEASGEIVVVMDGDLQHPPEVLDALIQPLLEHQADIVVATRYRGEGRADGLHNLWRQFVSRSARRVVQIALPRARGISDPLGGFFAFRREVVDGVDLTPVGFKILLEILVRGRWANVAEVPYTFASRGGGSSKASAREGVRFVRHVGRLLPARGAERVIDLRDERGIVVTGSDTGPIRKLISRVPPRLAAVVVTVVIAFAASLWSLATAVRSTSDLAYLVVAAPLALIVLAARLRPGRVEPEIHDREVDALIGALLLTASAALLFTGTRHATTLFWAHRVDLLAFPVFLAGVVALLLGTRTLWRARAASVFAVLVWPAAARLVLADPLSSVTNGTARFIGSIADRLGVATSSDGGRLLTIARGGQTYVVHFTADAHTAATLVAFVLVASAFVIVRRYPRGRALTFVAAGGVLAWALRVVVTVAGLVAGAHTGPTILRFALGPWLDVAVVAAALYTMTRVLRLDAGLSTVQSGGPLRISSGRIPRVVGVVSVIALLVAVVSDVQIDRNDQLTTALGAPRLVAFSEAPTTPVGTTLVSHRTVSPPATAPTDATWTRLRYFTATSAEPSIVDVIDAPASAGLADTGLRSWYPVGWRTHSNSSRVHLSDGLDASMLVFRDPRGTWLALTWLWPVDVDGRSRLERVVVMPGQEPTDLTAAGASTRSSRWLDASQVPALRASVRELGTELAQGHLTNARIPDRPIVTVRS